MLFVGFFKIKILDIWQVIPQSSKKITFLYYESCEEEFDSVLIESSIFKEEKVNTIWYIYVHTRGVILNKLNTC